MIRLAASLNEQFLMLQIKLKLRSLALLGQSQKSSNSFLGGLRDPRTPPQVGRCRGLQGCAMAKGCSDLVTGLECRLQNSQVIPSPGMPSLGLSLHIFNHFLETPTITYGQLGRHYFWHFLEMRRTSCRKKFRNGAQKKVPESAGLVGGSGPSLAQT